MTALMLDEVCQFLVGWSPQITVGNGPPANLAFGTNLFSGEMPAQPVDCVALWTYGGGVPHLVDNVDEPTFQVRVRDTIYTTGETTVNSIFNALQGIYERTLVASGDWYWNRMFAIQNPFYLGRDELQRHQFACNFRGFVRNPFRGGSGNVDH